MIRRIDALANIIKSARLISKSPPGRSYGGVRWDLWPKCDTFQVPIVVINFTDGEVVLAEAPEITFDLAILDAELRSINQNSERALFPVSAIRQILVGDPEPAPPEADVATWDRAAFHFIDGMVLRASIRSDAHLGRYGGVWRIVQPGTTELRTIAVPYASLKGVYQIRQWDSRTASERDEHSELDQLARVLAERERTIAGGGTVPTPRPLLSRMRRPPGSA